jgi:hypothetical protein
MLILNYTYDTATTILNYPHKDDSVHDAYDEEERTTDGSAYHMAYKSVTSSNFHERVSTNQQYRRHLQSPLLDRKRHSK